MNTYHLYDRFIPLLIVLSITLNATQHHSQRRAQLVNGETERNQPKRAVVEAAATTAAATAITPLSRSVTQVTTAPVPPEGQYYSKLR
jgi:hypothetical protein